MIAIASFFPGRQEYYDLRKIFENSFLKHMPDIEPHIYELQMNESEHHKATSIGFDMAVNFLLTDHFSSDEHVIAVCDIDLMFRRSITDIEDQEFDLAFTVREHPAKYNTGLWFARMNAHSIEFIKRWQQLTRTITDNFKHMKSGIQKYAGIDQYSLAICIKEFENQSRPKIKFLPCQEWNAEQTYWDKIDENTRVIHIKSQLRNELFGRPQNTKADGGLSDKIKIIPECVKLAEEARSFL